MNRKAIVIGSGFGGIAVSLRLKNLVLILQLLKS